MGKNLHSKTKSRKKKIVSMHHKQLIVPDCIRTLKIPHHASEKKCKAVGENESEQ